MYVVSVHVCVVRLNFTFSIGGLIANWLQAEASALEKYAMLLLHTIINKQRFFARQGQGREFFGEIGYS